MPARDVTPSELLADRPARLRIVVADDDALLREGMASLLEGAGHQVVGRARDAPDLLLKVRSYSPDVAIVDVRMPPGNADDGLVAAVEIRRSHPGVAVLVLSQHLEPAYMLELVSDDASGVVSGAPSPGLAAAERRLRAGRRGRRADGRLGPVRGARTRSLAPG